MKFILQLVERSHLKVVVFKYTFYFGCNFVTNVIGIIKCAGEIRLLLSGRGKEDVWELLSSRLIDGVLESW